MSRKRCFLRNTLLFKHSAHAILEAEVSCSCFSFGLPLQELGHGPALPGPPAARPARGAASPQRRRLGLPGQREQREENISPTQPRAALSKQPAAASSAGERTSWALLFGADRHTHLLYPQCFQMEYNLEAEEGNLSFHTADSQNKIFLYHDVASQTQKRLISSMSKTNRKSVSDRASNPPNHTEVTLSLH